MLEELKDIIEEKILGSIVLSHVLNRDNVLLGVQEAPCTKDETHESKGKYYMHGSMCT